jgi:hypothetical protein
MAGSPVGLAKHAVGDIDTVDLVGVQLEFDAVGKNSCATADIGNMSGGGGLQERDNFVLRWPVEPALEALQVVYGSGQTKRAPDRIVHSAPSRRHVEGLVSTHVHCVKTDVCIRDRRQSQSVRCRAGLSNIDLLRCGRSRRSSSRRIRRPYAALSVVARPRSSWDLVGRRCRSSE